MSFIREGGRQVQKRFAEVLRLFWEGLLFEYLRSVGCPLRDAEHDPRHFVTRYWRRSLLDPSLRPGFVPFYLTRGVGLVYRWQRAVGLKGKSSKIMTVCPLIFDSESRRFVDIVHDATTILVR